MTDGEGFGRRLLLSFDAKSYGSADDLRQAAIQVGLLKVLDEAASGAGLDRGAWVRQGGGDGELAVLPADTDEPRVVDDFVRKLHAALVRHNHDLRESAWLRLRMAIHFGVAMPAPNGFSGQGPVVVSRLADSAPLKRALELSGEPLAVALSNRIHEDVVAQRHTSLTSAELRGFPVVNKEFSETAWLWLPGGDIHALDLADGERNGSPAPSGAAKAVPAHGSAAQSYQFHGDVHAPGATFGNSYR